MGEHAARIEESRLDCRKLSIFVAQSHQGQESAINSRLFHNHASCPEGTDENSFCSPMREIKNQPVKL
jgi:hypothetical protein